MRHIRRFGILFVLGAILYPALEILFRGYSHISMSILGGISLVAIDLVDLLLGNVRRIWKAAISALLITQMELITGLLVNVKMGLEVWDYSALPFQLAGQICLLFSFLWFLLSYLALALISAGEAYLQRRRLKRKQK